MARPVHFVGIRQIYHADTCRPLVAAARTGQVRLEALARGAYPGDRMPPNAVPGVRSVGFWDAATAQTWGLSEHRNEGIEFTFLASGRCGFAVGAKRYELRPGSLTVTRPWQPHRVGLPHVGPGRLYWLILDVGVRRPHQPWRWPAWLVLDRADLRLLTSRLRTNEQPVWHAPELQGRFRSLGHLIESRDTIDHLASRLAVELNALLLEILHILRGPPPTPQPELQRAHRSVQMFLEELEDALDQPWTLERMAEAAGMGRTRFATCVRELTNLTPIQYLTRRRLERARQLLREDPRPSITEIALECGFGSSQYFATVYRRAFGCAPRDERRAAR